MNYNNKVFTLKDGKKYMTIEQVEFEKKTYLYLVNVENDLDSMYVEINEDTISPIEPGLFNNYILPLFIQKLAK